MFHTLKYAKMLESAGFTREQSETTVKILVEVMEDKLATKEDIRIVRNDLRAESQQLKHEIRQLRSDLIIRMGAMQAASIGLLVALLKLL